MTEKNALQKYTVAGVADVLGCFGIPTGTAMQIYNDILGKRTQESMEILLSEIRQGNFSNVDQDDVVSIIARFQRDAMEGVAKNNLRLMARVINGMAKKQKLKAPSFLRYATILASLTDKEIRILSVMVKYKEYKLTDTDGICHVSSDARHKSLLAVTQQAEGHMQALMRTGLVNMVTDKIDYNLENTNNYRLTKLMDEVLEYIPDIQIRDEAA